MTWPWGNAVIPRVPPPATVLILAFTLPGCAAPSVGPARVITVRWQRLVTETGTTCTRCGTTQAEVRRAVDTLRRCLGPLNLAVRLEEVALTPEAVGRDTAQSNRVFIEDRPLEDWLGAGTGMSPCGSCCEHLGPGVQCRTVAVDGQTYEAVPAQLIIRAGLRAAEATLARLPAGAPCCPPSGGADESSTGAR